MVNAGQSSTRILAQMAIGRLSLLDLLAELQTNPSSTLSRAQAAASRMSLTFLKNIPTPHPRATESLAKFRTDVISLSITLKASMPKLLHRPSPVVVIRINFRPLTNVSRELFTTLFSLLFVLRLPLGAPLILS